MNDESLDAFLAKEQNTIDYLTRVMYGPDIKFERLSAIGQHTIEQMARNRVLATDPDPELRASRAEVIDLKQENTELTKKLAAALRDNQELWEENEDYRIREYDAEATSSRRSTRLREVTDQDILEAPSVLRSDEVVEDSWES